MEIYLMSVLFLFAGLTHFRKPRMYERIMPKWVPMHRPIIYITGAWEMISAILLLVPATRSLAAWSTIVLLILVFPANIQMAINFRRNKHKYYWLTLVRLLLQPLLIWWAWFYT